MGKDLFDFWRHLITFSHLGQELQWLTEVRSGETAFGKTSKLYEYYFNLLYGWHRERVR